MKFLVLVLMLAGSAFAGIEYKAEFPKGPEAELTPGSLCDRPDSHRYPEQIAYCSRDVDSQTKADVFKEYRNNGYILDPKTRSQYKIDHLIPLCAGGSNQENNLWPQHVTVYTQTDPLEPLLCQKMKDGKLKQAEAVKLVLAAKKDLSLVAKTITYLQNL